MESKLYFYRAFVSKVYDGDTITVDIDLGLNVNLKGEKVRLFGINAPEMRGQEKQKGKVSRDFLRSLVLKKNIYIKTIKDKKGKYGRYIAEVFVNDKLSDELINVNRLMVKKGFAVEKNY